MSRTGGTVTAGMNRSGGGNTMPNLTKEQWKQVEDQLSGPFGRVELMADGYKLTLQVQGYKALRQCVVVFVDGVSKGEWYKGEAPEAKKFCCEKRSWLYPAKKREEAKAKLKSRRLDPFLRELYKDIAECYSAIWVPYWFAPKSLTRHLRKTCENIEVVDLGYRV